jgi:hypothetical protein
MNATDHIFTFYRLLPSRSSVSLTPDYDENLSCGELYRKVAVDLMREEVGLDLHSVISVMCLRRINYVPT